MSGLSRVPFSNSSKKHGQDLQEQDKSVRPVTHINGKRIYFKDLARFAWPEKTEANLAFHLQVDGRTARRWLADDNEPPAEAMVIIMREIMTRYAKRD